MIKTRAVAIIPARGGSKRIPRKNIKEFCGMPLIAYSILAAQDSGCFDDVIVSTDDQQIADIAIKYGASVPFLRSKDLSDDYATTMDVMSHATKQLGNNVQFVCCIYATAPLLLGEDLRSAYESLIAGKDIDYVFSITDFAFPIQRALKLGEKNQVSMFDAQYMSTRSQDLEEAFHDAGQFYWGRKEAWGQKKTIFSEHAVGFKIPRYRVQDIDTLDDWVMAELLYKSWQSRS